MPGAQRRGAGAMIVTRDVLRAGTGCNDALAGQWLDPIKLAFALFTIDSPAQIGMLLANIGHESGGMRYVREIWGPTDAQRRYEGRVDLGNNQPGDGKRFMGRGILQITGRSNYASERDGLRAYLQTVPDFETDPAQLEIPPWAALSAAHFWHRNKIGAYADAGDFDGVCDKINRGRKTAVVGDSNGYADRLRLWTSVRPLLGV
jgi:putative chitinase